MKLTPCQRRALRAMFRHGACKTGTLNGIHGSTAAALVRRGLAFYSYSFANSRCSTRDVSLTAEGRRAAAGAGISTKL